MVAQLGGCLKAVVVTILLIIGLAVVGNTIMPGSPRTEQAEIPAAEPVNPQQRAENMLALAEEIPSFDLMDGLETVEGVGIRLGILQAWSETAAPPATNEAETTARQQLIEAISRKQRQELPRIRDAYGPILRKVLWEDDITARTIGEGYRIVDLVGGAFAANRNIGAAQAAIEEILLRLRFTESRYRWYQGASEYTRYTLQPPADGAVVVWSGRSWREID